MVEPLPSKQMVPVRFWLAAPYRGIVQMVEQRSPKPYGIGSNPFAPANSLMSEADNPTYKNLRGRSYTISGIGITVGKT